MEAAITLALQMLAQLVPSITSSVQTQAIIEGLITLLPTLIKIAQGLVQPVKNIIAALSVNEATTAAQMAQLKELDAQVDAAFEAAAVLAEAEDAKADQP